MDLRCPSCGMHYDSNEYQGCKEILCSCGYPILIPEKILRSTVRFQKVLPFIPLLLSPLGGTLLLICRVVEDSIGWHDHSIRKGLIIIAMISQIPSAALRELMGWEFQYSGATDYAIVFVWGCALTYIFIKFYFRKELKR